MKRLYFVPSLPHTQNYAWINTCPIIIVFTSIAIWKRLLIHYYNNYNIIIGVNIRLVAGLIIHSWVCNYINLVFQVWTFYLSTYIAMFLCFYLSIFLSLYLSIYLFFYLSIFLSLYLSISLSFYLSISLSFYLSIFLSLYLSISLSAYLFIFISPYLSCSIFLSPYLSCFISIPSHTPTC